MTRFFFYKLLFGLMVSVLATHTAAAQSLTDVATVEQYLRTRLDRFHLTAQDLAEYRVSDHYASNHNQVTHLYLVQQHQGLDVHNAMVNANLKNGQVIFLGSHFVGNLSQKVNAVQPILTPTTALLATATHAGCAIQNTPTVLDEKSNSQRIVFDKANFALQNPTVQLVYQPMEDGALVRLAWDVSLYERGGQNWWSARVDALTGEVLEINNLVVHCHFSEGSFSHEPHRRSSPEQLTGTHQLNSGASYRVFEIPLESPLHGGRTLAVNPADSMASPFGWHDTNGQAGAEYTITRGNNVYAYSDSFNINASASDEPDGGQALLFDFPLDFSKHPSENRDAAVTNLFYMNNRMHDYWYHYGFDEAAGNFQAKNYSGTGIGQDPVQAEAQDGGGTNNASFATPTDGTAPRMQMYLWDVTPPNVFTVNSPTSVAGGYTVVQGSFGGNITSTPITANLVLVNDGTLAPTLGCNPLTNGAQLTGNIAMIDRGNCEFGLKALNAENAGAVAVVVCNNQPGLVSMGAGAVGGQVTIPALFMAKADCDKMKIAIQGGTTVNVTLVDATAGTTPPLDGDFDNGVIAHEYTHGISNRLTGGPSAANCLTNQEQVGEGWSDWFALVMTTELGDLGTDKRGMGVYANSESVTGNGIRTYPYSTDLGLNPLTMKDIASESVPHGVGAIWATMIWDLYWNLVAEYGFDPDIKNGTGGNNIAMQLVMDGLKFQSCNPSFVESRDAILAADFATFNGAYECIIWETFARRGLGYSASSGSGANVGDNIEAFDVPLACMNEIQIKKTATAEVTAGNDITYTIEVSNFTSDTAQNVVVTDTLPTGVFYVANSSSCNATQNGNVLKLNIGAMLPYAKQTCAFKTTTSSAFYTTTFYKDDIETANLDWSSLFLSTGGTQGWSRQSSANAHSGQYSWSVPNVATAQDVALVSDITFTVTGAKPALSFWHQFNTDPGHDGGRVEISEDYINWADLKDYFIEGGYNGLADAYSPTAYCFTGNSNGYQRSIVDLSNFIGKTLYLRFRFNTNATVGGTGWRVDDIELIDLYAVFNTACVGATGGYGSCASVAGLGTVVRQSETNTPTVVRNTFDLLVFPNPAKDMLTVKLMGVAENEADATVFSADGRTVFQQHYRFSAADPTLRIPTQLFANGVYFLKISTPQGIATQRFVVQQN